MGDPTFAQAVANLPETAAACEIWAEMLRLDQERFANYPVPRRTPKKKRGGPQFLRRTADIYT